ncbi:MAG: type secretion rane fusion protein HlyD family [Rhodospirillales bacterium]|nr:type secretion rane fusion protein HlyD family [Rhodospirillales bacterium]
MESGKGELALVAPRGRRSHELAFLPAALEIVETPASPVGRAVAATIIAFFCLALVWACLGSIDIVASAPGKIIPSGRTKMIQPFEIGIVHAIDVQEGQTVKAGDVLIELDPTTSAAEQEHLASDLMASQLDVARLRAALAETGDPMAAFVPPPGAPASQLAVQRQLLESQIAEQNGKLAALDGQRAQKQAERATVAATIDKLEATIPVLKQRLEVRKYLSDKEYGSKITYLEALQDALEHEHDLAVQKSHYQEAEAALVALSGTREQTVSEYRHKLSVDLAAAEQKAAGLTQDLIKARERTQRQVLTAPVDGTVQQVQVSTIGGVVTPAQQLMVIVPSDSRLVIEAMVQNKDIGFIAAGQEAEVKIDTFTFTKYGLLRGTVLTVSRDAIQRDKGDGTQQNGQGQQPGGQTSPELVYTARVSLDRTQMPVEGRMVNLEPGMAVTVEIKTGSRRIIDYILSPLQRYSHESLRER